MLAAALVSVLLAAPANAEPESERCTCARNDYGVRCNNACLSTPGPEIIAALRKRFPDFESADRVIDNLSGGYEVTFYTKKWHMACEFTPPAKLGKRRIIHA